MVRDGTSSSLFDMTVRMLSIATAMIFLPKNNESNSKTFTKKDVLCKNRDVTKSEKALKGKIILVKLKLLF